jgi:7-carboxy-7-deazaguanine synthase
VQNKQPPEAPRDLDTIEFHSAWVTIQGEGPFAGSPAVFIRLAGCNLQCPLCDTEYTEKREPLTAEEILSIVKRLAYPPSDSIRANYRLVVITGGEPFRQRIGNLCQLLADSNFWVQIETNGTLAPLEEKEFPFSSVCIVCSPKTSRVHPLLIPHISAYKYVLEYGNLVPEDGLPATVLGYNRIPFRAPANVDRKLIFVQPLDDSGRYTNISDAQDSISQNLKAAAKSAMRFGYTLSVQMHKLAGLP